MRSTDDATTPEETVHPITRPLAHCPSCGSEHLDPVVENDGFSVHFLCADCSRCWHVELGFVRRVAPSACLGCPERPRCEAAYASDHPADPASVDPAPTSPA